MILRKVCLSLGLAALLGPSLSSTAKADTPTSTPGSGSPTAAVSAQEVQDMDAKVRDLRELFDRLELQAEQTKSQIDKAKPQAISFGSGEVTIGNSMAWPVATTLSGTANTEYFSSLPGAQALLGFNLNPAPEVTGNVQVEFLGPVALNRLLPQEENALYQKGEWAVLRKGELKFEDDDFMARAFRAVPRPDLFEEGDMFYMFPAADDTNKYFRQTGRAVPSGFQFLAKDGLGIAKGFEVWAGDELTYGQPPEVFARYKRHLGSIDFSVMADWQSDPAHLRGANTWDRQEAWIRTPLWDGESLDLVAARQAGQVGQTYNTVESVAPGTGTLGSNYLVDTKTTTEADAWAGQARLKGSKNIPFLEEETLTGIYGGPLDVNVMSLQGLVSTRPQRYTLISLEAGWQKPVVGFNPTLVIGTPGLNFGILPGTGARPYGSAVAVVDDPVTGSNNREMTWVTATLEFNPGQGWFYKYRPRVVEDWNFNSDLKTPFSSALSVHFFNCPTGTDLSRYFSAAGVLVPEAPGSSGKAPTDGWLYTVSDITSISTGSVQSWAEISTGQQLAGLSASNDAVPANTYFSSKLSSKYKSITLSGGYAEDIYGPDDWYQNEGFIIGNVYTASLLYSLGNSEISIQYEGWRDKSPSLYHFPGNLNVVNFAGGSSVVETPIDQVMTSYTIRF
jgi:hypothetical protein